MLVSTRKPRKEEARGAVTRRVYSQHTYLQALDAPGTRTAGARLLWLPNLPSQTQTLNVPPVGQLVVVVALVLYDALHHTALGRPHTLQGFRVVFRVAPQHVLDVRVGP
jgi:hypothetical protein